MDVEVYCVVCLPFRLTGITQDHLDARDSCPCPVHGDRALTVLPSKREFALKGQDLENYLHGVRRDLIALHNQTQDIAGHVVQWKARQEGRASGGLGWKNPAAIGSILSAAALLSLLLRKEWELAAGIVLSFVLSFLPGPAAAPFAITVLVMLGSFYRGALWAGILLMANMAIFFYLTRLRR